uniref:Uncharacterized protein n=1 Tax=Populus davidiana TaxID=266767 RepID=A0A6M2F7Q6_9ROSI
MSKHLIKTHHKPNAKTHRWSTLLNDLNLRTHLAPKPLTRPLKPNPPLLLIFFFFFKPNPFLVDGATILRRMILYFRMYIKQVLSALGTRYFEHVLLDIIQNCSHQKASVRDGYLTLFKYLPRSLGVQFQNYLQHVLPAILDGLVDENESVRDAASGAGHVLVEHYATTHAFIVLPCFFVFSWR